LLTDQEIDDIRERLAASSPGPWKDYLEARDKFSGSDFIMTGGEDIYVIGGTAGDFAFIAQARDDIPRLLDEIDRLKAMLSSESD
jgi:hypothetical protein